MSTEVQYTGHSFALDETFATVKSACPLCGEVSEKSLTLEDYWLNEQYYLLFSHGEEHVWKVHFTIRVRLDLGVVE